jgi:hypothetical protein
MSSGEALNVQLPLLSFERNLRPCELMCYEQPPFPRIDFLCSALREKDLQRFYGSRTAGRTIAINGFRFGTNAGMSRPFFSVHRRSTIPLPSDEGDFVLHRMCIASWKS